MFFFFVHKYVVVAILNMRYFCKYIKEVENGGERREIYIPSAGTKSGTGYRMLVFYF